MIQANPASQFVMQLIAAPFTAIVSHYASCLMTSERAWQFVSVELALSSEQAAKEQIGYVDRSFGKLIPTNQNRAGRELRSQLQAIGILKDSGHETLRGYVTVPIRDEHGVIIGIRGYKVDPKAKGEAVVVIGDELAAKDAKYTKEDMLAERREPSGSAATNDSTKDDFNTTAILSQTEHADTPESLRSAANESVLVTQDSSLIFTVSDRHYRIRGLEKNTSTTTLKVNLMVSRDSLVHLDSLDLVKARSRASFIKAAATELFVDADLIKRDLGKILLQLETLQADRIDELKKPKSIVVKLSADEEREAMSLLRDPNLLERIVADFDACGIVGESTGKIAGYLAATSRKLSRPLAIVIQSSSSAGKTSLMDAILDMMPSEDVQRFSGMTGRSLFYLDSESIRHKILAISEDEGASEATYALKLLQSEGELRHATVGRGENGRVQTQEHHVEGPVQIFLTTTAMHVDEELVNRCLVLSVDETRNQTGSILSRQRSSRTLDAIVLSETATRLRTLHQNAQRLLKPLRVVNPFAPQLTFATNKTRLRRDHEKYLTLIDTIAFLHQHQREIHTIQVPGSTSSLTPEACSLLEYINVERNDIAIANGIAGEVLGRSLDELSPQTRSLLVQLHSFVNQQAKSLSVPRNAVRFTRRELRNTTGIGNSQVSVHLSRLVELEYVLAHRGRNGQRFVYELLYNGEGFEGQPFLMGLINPAELRHPSSTTTTTMTTFRGSDGTFRPKPAS